MKKNKTGLLTMCLKAGRMTLGMDLAKDMCRNGEAFGVFVASDLSEKSLKEIKYYCSRYETPLYSVGMTMDELGTALGKRSGIIAVSDKGFAKSCAEGLDRIETDRMEDQINGSNN